MQISILHVALIVIIGTIAISMIGTRKGKGKASDDKQVAKKGIVGHEQATPMAVRTLAPAFAEQTDWSQFEQPAFLRKKTQKPARKRNTQKAEAPVDAKPAQSKQASTPAAETATAPAAAKKTRQTPQQQMEEFRQNSRNRSQKPGFVEV